MIEGESNLIDGLFKIALKGSEIVTPAFLLPLFADSAIDLLWSWSILVLAEVNQKLQLLRLFAVVAGTTGV